LPECRDYGAKAKTYTTVGKHAVTCWYEQFWHEELGRLAMLVFTLYHTV